MSRLSYFYECGYCDACLQQVVDFENGVLGTIGILACGHKHFIGENISLLDGLYEKRADGDWWHLTTKWAEDLEESIKK